MKYHPERAACIAQYEKAHAAWVKSTQGTDEAAYLSADAVLENARRNLVAAEQAHPTGREIAKRMNRQRLENRGLLT